MEELNIHVLTRVYNAEKTIRRTIESVLRQTYPNFTYVIRDNGSTDGTYDICWECAARDPRIKLVRNRKNDIYETKEDVEALKADQGIRYGTALGENDYVCILDADDEYLPDFFERAVQYGREMRADIVIGGTETVQEGTGQKLGGVVHPQPILLAGNGFSDAFTQYHWHLRQVWGKLYRRRTLLGYLDYYKDFLERTLGSREAVLPYGADTIYALYAFQHAERVGILSGCSHRYYIQKKSVSYTLSPNRVSSDVILHNATVDFLIKKCGRVSPQNRLFLQTVYSYAVADTVSVIQNASLSPAEKLREYRKIAENPITLAAYRECTDESAGRSKTLLLQAALKAGAALGSQDSDDLRAVAQLLLPRCGRSVSAANAKLFLGDQTLLQALFRDEPEPILADFLERLKKNQNVKKYALPEAVCALAAENPLLCRIDDPVFLRKYGELYLKVWRGDHLKALEEMTGLLLEKRVSSGQETFLNLYISLAALENQSPAFVFGKIQLAQLYWRQNRCKECRDLIAELEEMGLTDNEEINALKSRLKAVWGSNQEKMSD